MTADISIMDNQCNGLAVHAARDESEGIDETSRHLDARTWTLHAPTLHVLVVDLFPPRLRPVL